MNSEEWRRTAEDATEKLETLVFGQHNLGVSISPQEEKAVKDAYEILRKYFVEEEEEERKPDTWVDDWYDEFREFRHERSKK